jgi:trans-aconitate methyltransferase
LASPLRPRNGKGSPVALARIARGLQDDLAAITAGLTLAWRNGVTEGRCGTGDIAPELTPHVARVHAVDPSITMLTRGKALPGGQHANIQWMVSTAEEFSYPSQYALVVAAESLHWMDWDRVLPLTPRVVT